jgi:hypothetical protein
VPRWWFPRPGVPWHAYWIRDPLLLGVIEGLKVVVAFVALSPCPQQTNPPLLFHTPGGFDRHTSRLPCRDSNQHPFSSPRECSTADLGRKRETSISVHLHPLLPITGTGRGSPVAPGLELGVEVRGVAVTDPLPVAVKLPCVLFMQVEGGQVAPPSEPALPPHLHRKLSR